MVKEITLVLSPEQAASENALTFYASQQLGIDSNEISHIIPKKKSIDARTKDVKIIFLLHVYINEKAPESDIHFKYQNVSNKTPVIIVGSGPAGMFAALRLIELGKKPIILERGKDVQARRRDIAAINKEHIVNPDSNYCFGEGGAGTYSDGKLYTRSKKRGDIARILKILVAHGAKEDILYEAHPHIGTNKLPKLVAAIRETILTHGGEIHFNTKVVDFIIENNTAQGVICQDGKIFKAKKTILATGHSARDIFEILDQKKVRIEFKPFAMGVRVEHTQQTIDSIQYHCKKRNEYLPPAPYSLVHQVKGRGVFSFCMCPGGFIVPAATSPGEVVVNGMSPSKRDSKFANSGIVVAIEKEDLQKFASFGEFAGLNYQKSIEKMAFESGGKTQTAPAQRLVDFVSNKTSANLPETSYQPGIVSAPLHTLLPKDIGERLQQGFAAFGKKMKGYLTNDAIIVGVESRSSSPIKIPRDKETLEHIQIKGLYPCGEGAGYAGGIVSAAMDGERCAESAANAL
jgi:uncharacterized protein